jgi:hypothetical protein
MQIAADRCSARNFPATWFPYKSPPDRDRARVHDHGWASVRLEARGGAVSGAPDRLGGRRQPLIPCFRAERVGFGVRPSSYRAVLDDGQCLFTWRTVLLDEQYPGRA